MPFNEASHFSLYVSSRTVVACRFSVMWTAPLSQRVVDGMSGPRWQEEMAREIFTPFAGDVAPLLRATLIHEANRAVFILAAHHTISDGVSMAAALCDLFHVLAGGTIELHPLIPPLEESLRAPPPQ